MMYDGLHKTAPLLAFKTVLYWLYIAQRCVQNLADYWLIVNILYQKTKFWQLGNVT